jgi:cobalt/nickel transport system ATP-binding protein
MNNTTLADLKNISWSYESGRNTESFFAGKSSAEQPNLFDNFSLNIKENQKTVIMGANGSGKSTLLSILAGLKYPTAGEYLYKKRLVNKNTMSGRVFPTRFRREVGFMFQNPDIMLFNPTVYDELLFGPRQFHLNIDETEVDYWLKETGLERYKGSAPYKLSGGEKKRLCLAALLIMKPKLLLLDEPTAGLDRYYTDWVFEIIKKQRKSHKMATVVTTHESCLHKEMGSRIIHITEHNHLNQ